MDQSLKSKCDRSFYEEVYHYEDGKRALVRDIVSGRIFVRKELSVYNREVFHYLKNNPNPHIPHIHTFWEEDRHLVVIEELISGDTLDFVLANQQLDEAARKDILLQICDGLLYLHQAHPQIIHRDLKPSNIMVTDDHVVKIIDYDAAKIFDELQTRDTMLIGTQGSAAPEQYGFGKCDERTDIYALGVLIRDMFPDQPRMQKIADKATRLEPENRYRNVQKLRRALQGTFAMEIPPLTFKYLPGFRTGKIWKMAIAICGYAYVVYFSFDTDFSSQGVPLTGLPLFLNRCGVFGMLLTMVDLYTGWTGLFRRIPLLHHENITWRVLGYAICTFAIIVFWAVFTVVMVDIIT